MKTDIAKLTAPIEGEALILAPMTAAHREEMRAICPVDDPVWEIYPASFAGEHFDDAFDAIVNNVGRYPFIIHAEGRAVGMSGYLNLDPASGVVEIGGTYMTPAVRGTGINRRVKALLIPRAFDSGFQRIEFRIDARNARSLRAVEKLGAVREGVLRRQRVTWTGHLRDTVVLSILRDEWAAA